jgi:hypothetical protein
VFAELILSERGQKPEGVLSMTAVRTLTTSEIDSVAGAGSHTSIKFSPVLNVLANNKSPGGVVAFGNSESIIVGGNNKIILGGFLFG